MKKYFLFALFLSFQAAVFAQGINFFHGNYEELQLEAKKQHKLIFIDCYTIWCGPCNKMSRDVFTRKDVGDFYNEKFVCYKLDMEKGEGLTIAKTYEVHSYPTYLYLNDQGELEHRALGSMEPSLFIEDGKTAANPEENLRGLATRFVNGSRDTTLLHKLIEVTSEVEPELHKKALTAYWLEISDFRILEQTNWNIFKSYENDVRSKAFEYVVNYKKDFDAKYGKSVVDNVLFSKAAASLRVAADNKDDALFKSATKIISGCSDDEINTTAGLNTLRYYRKTGDWKQYLLFAAPFLDKYGKSQEIYNSVAWEMVANCGENAVLTEALVYSEKSIEFDKNYGNTDTRANVLYKLKRYKEAKIAAQESIGLAKKEKLDYTSTQELLDKIEKSMSN